MTRMEDRARRARWPVVAAVIFNLVPIAGVLLWGWNAFALIFLYWLENLAIGGRTVLSMLASALYGPVRAASALATAAFFTVHFGIFCFVHGVFVVSMFSGETSAGAGLFDLWSTTQRLFATQPGLLSGLFSVALWQAVLFGVFIVRGEARTANPLKLMAASYPRIIILHVTIIFGGFLLMMLNQPVAGLALLALVKAAFDVAEARGEGLMAELQARLDKRLSDEAARRGMPPGAD